jgi:Mg-chelatase subunit ChlD
MTSERHLALGFKAQAPAEILPGLPAMVRTVENPLALASDQRVGRQLLEQFAEKKPEQVEQFQIINKHLERDEKNPPSPDQRTETANVKVTAVYRGHVVNVPTVVTIHREPNITAYQYLEPLQGSFAVRADRNIYTQFAESNGQITIVVDFSGSMNTQKGGAGPTRKDVALDTLENVLRNLPNGPKVSVWVFAQEKAGIKVEEDTIERRLAPTSWSQDKLAPLMDELRGLHPAYGTPLVRAMYEAYQSDLADNQKGSERMKTLLVLTDGQDSRFVKGIYPDEFGQHPSNGDQKLNPNSKGDPNKRPDKSALKEIPTFLEKVFGKSDVAVNMVLFQVEPDERENAHAQFDIVKKFRVPGSVVEAAEAKDLFDKLMKGVTQRLRCRLAKSTGDPVPPPDGIDVTVTGDNPQWFRRLQSASFVASSHTWDRDLMIERGDYLVAKLTPDGFQRALLAETYPNKPKIEKGDWRLTALQNQRVSPNEPLEMLASLEDYQNRPFAGKLKQVKPSFAWFEVQPQGSKQPISQRFYNLPRYPASMVGIDVSGWTGEQAPRPQLQAWWTDSGGPHIDTSVKRKADRVPLPDDFKEPLQLEDGQKVVIESVEIEKRLVKNAWEADPELTSCLVVRVRYPKGSPVLVQVGGLPEHGQEHRLYEAANRYTGVFWPVTETQANGNFSLNVISLEAFKKKYSQATELALDPPATNDARGDIRLRGP